MKKTVFGGFCLLGGILLAVLTGALNFCPFGGYGDIVLEIIGAALSVYGFVLGFLQLKKEN